MNHEQLRIKELKAKLELAQNDLSIRTAELERVESERDALQSWKDSAMAVEREWDAQAIASMLGVPPGQSTRKGIAERVPQLIARVTSLQRILDQRWEMMRELEEVCGTKDVAKAVEYIKGLKARATRLEDALEIGVGLNRARELMSDNHVCDATELVKRTKEVPCPDCYGGHFRPCNICGDSGVALLRIEAKESKP